MFVFWEHWSSLFSSFLLLLSSHGSRRRIKSQPQNNVLKAQTNFATQDISYLLLILYIYIYIISIYSIKIFVGGATSVELDRQDGLPSLMSRDAVQASRASGQRQ